jgi:hypothetical protein
MPVESGETKAKKWIIENRNGRFMVVRLKETGRGIELMLLEVFE